MSRSPSTPSRFLPDNPSLDQLRKQAKDLLKSYRAGSPAAVAEVARWERNPEAATFQLADAQRVLARSYGFASWTRLKQHIEVAAALASFCAAARAGDVALLRQLAAVHPSLVQAASGGTLATSALHLAVLNRDAEMTRALMELGSDAHTGIWPHRAATTAHVLAQERGYDELVAIIEAEESRRRQAMSAPGAAISTQIETINQAILAGRYDEAMSLLAADLSLVGSCDVHGATPLHMAAWKHNPEMVTWLLNHGALVDAHLGVSRLSRAPTDEGSGKTPLDYAAIVAGWSAHGRDFSFLENSRVEPAHFYETVRLLRAHGAELTPRAAVATSDADAVRQMHRTGQLANEIHLYRGGLLAIAVRVNRGDMVSLLLDLGLDPDETVHEGDARSWGMPLWFAVMCGRQDIAQLLSDRGADVNAIVYACGDPLSIADRTEDRPMQTLLLEHGARITVERVAATRDREAAQAILAGKLPAHSLNVRDPSLTDLAEQMLWAAGSSDAEILRRCLPHVSRKRDDPWWNYVFLSATLLDSLRVLLDHGIDPDVVGSSGFTLLHHLATKELDETERLAFATMLLDAGASLQRRDTLLKSTPLAWACRWGRLPLVQLYLSRGADAVEADAEPWATPLAWATQARHTAVIELLRSHGAK